MKRNESARAWLRRFLTDCYDGERSVEEAFELLLHLHFEARMSSAPLLELVNLLKNEKPVLHHYLRIRCRRHPRMRLLFEANLPYDVAKGRIEEFIGK